MAYNNRNVLKRMVRIQDLVLEQKRHGVTQVHVYKTMIEPAFNISYSTFNRYLSYPAKRELKRKGQPTAEDERQLKLF